jgi:predicted thioesterase
VKNPFTPGAQKRFTRIVRPEDTARFDAGEVHPVYGTFALARDAEWTCRLFVLEMLEQGEEGIGAYVSVEHLAPAVVGTEVEFVATLESVEGNTVVCRYEARDGEKIIARGRQTQKILDLARFRSSLKRT